MKERVPPIPLIHILLQLDNLFIVWCVFFSEHPHVSFALVYLAFCLSPGIYVSVCPVGRGDGFPDFFQISNLVWSFGHRLFSYECSRQSCFSSLFSGFFVSILCRLPFKTFSFLNEIFWNSLWAGDGFDCLLIPFPIMREREGERKGKRERHLSGSAVLSNEVTSNYLILAF